MDSGLPPMDPAFCDFCMVAYTLGPCSWHSAWLKPENQKDWENCITRFRVRVLREGYIILYRALFGRILF